MSRILISIGLIFVAFFTGTAQVNDVLNTTVTISYKVKTIKKINTEYAEFSPVIFGSDLVFVSDRENDLVKIGENNWKKKKHLNIYKAAFTSPKDDSVSFSKTIAYDNNLPDYFHSGPICFHPSGNYALLTRVVSEKKTNKPQLYFMKKEGGKWTKPERLSFCGNDFSYGHANFSDDGNKVYFSSDQLGTLGGKDIFVSEFKNGTFGAPLNLGDKVNSTGDEMYPFYMDNKLYFSSNRSGSLGGLDVYKSHLADNQFEMAENLGNTLNSPEDDFSFFITKSGKNGFFASNRKGQGSDDIFFFTIDETATVVSKNIVGKFTYAKLDGQIPAGLELQLLDEAGNVVQTTTTDKDGQFKFLNLPADQDFTIKVVELGPDLLLHVYNKDGVEYAVLMSDSKGSFVYKKLDANDVGTLSFMETEDIGLDGKKTGKINGQFIHERLVNETVEGLNVLLVDEAGNIYMQTTTDKNGNFSFTKLPADQNLYLSTDSKYDDLKILLFNTKDEVIAELKRKGQEPFVYRRLDGKLDNTLTMLENEDISLFPPNYTNVSGKFKLSKLDGEPKALDFVVLDEAGNIIGKGKTDKNGNFIITGLAPQDVYIFKLVDEDGKLKPTDFQLQMLNRYGQELDMINPADGQFIFDKRPKTVVNTTLGAAVVYFNKNESGVSSEYTASLKPLVDQLKANPTLRLKLDGHADASSTDEYNRTLSMKRMLATKNYFIKNGIASKRIVGEYHGEKQLVNNCIDSDKCTEEENKLNRRCEAKIIK